MLKDAAATATVRRAWAAALVLALIPALASRLHADPEIAPEATVEVVLEAPSSPLPTGPPS
ncbi:MAG: hypothetical protein ACK6DV_30020, partial [Deltaproteobacteria bacterium]